MKVQQDRMEAQQDRMDSGAKVEGIAERFVSKGYYEEGKDALGKEALANAYGSQRYSPAGDWLLLRLPQKGGLVLSEKQKREAYAGSALEVLAAGPKAAFSPGCFVLLQGQLFEVEVDGEKLATAPGYTVIGSFAAGYDGKKEKKAGV